MKTLVEGDVCGGIVRSHFQNFVRVDYRAAVVVSPLDTVDGHGNGLHAAANLSTGMTQSFVRINGALVCTTGSVATCAHAAVASGFVRIT